MDSRHPDRFSSGQIVPDSPEAARLGFLSARFSGFLEYHKGVIYIWRIQSKFPGKGFLSDLVQRMLDFGYTVKVPTPIGRMAEIVRHKGFTRTLEFDPQMDPYEVWVKQPVPAPVDNREPEAQAEECNPTSSSCPP